MALARDLSTLPKGDREISGEPPDESPRFVHLLAQTWIDERAERGPKPTAHGTRLRHSDAGGCARNLGMGAAGLPITDPFDAAAVWVMTIGEKVHVMWQAAMQANYPRVEVEPKVRVSQELDASGSADAVIHLQAVATREDGWRVCYELKTVGGFSYKLKVGERGDPQGPDYSHKLQGALNAVGADCDELVIGYLSFEAISKPAAERMAKRGRALSEWDRFGAEWSYPREVFEPWAEREVKRFGRILEVVDAGELPPTSIPDPEIPQSAVITDPGSGRWEQWVHPKPEEGPPMLVDTGSTWRCGYCPRKTLCAEINSPGKVAVDQARAALERIGGSDG